MKKWAKTAHFFFMFRGNRIIPANTGPGLLELLGERRIQFSRVEIVLLETKVARLTFLPS